MRLFSLIIIVSLLVACQPETTTTAKKKTPAKKAQTNKKKAAKKNGAKKNAKKPSYWEQLKKELKINDAKIKELQKAKTEYTNAVKKLPKTSNGKKDPKKITALANARDSKMKRILGNTLYQKKVAFDKKLAQKNKKKKKAAKANTTKK